MRFIDLPTRKKLLMVFALFAALLVLLLIIASFLLLAMVNRQETLYRDDLGTVLSLERVDSLFQRNRSLVLEMTLTDANIEQHISDIEDGARTAMELLTGVEKTLAEQPQLQELLREYRRNYDAYRQTRSDLIFPALREGRPEEAVAAMTGIQLQRYNRIHELAREIMATALRDAEAAVARANENAYRAVAIFIAGGILAVFLGILSAVKLNRQITTPLNRITDQARQVAAGNLAIAIAGEERLDEFGTLGDAFAQMVESLRQLSRELQGGINVLASSGSQILAATTEMASGAAQTATSVNETTATVEEVKQTAHLATEKSQHVADIAQRAVQASQAGRGAVDDAVEGMRQIMGQMEAVTDSIVRLSELSQTIGGIITTVNDLAEQSNLLAVNAAIEAAKAGEHGKGFAVVAQEVRHLAGQSKQATAQVQAILGDIQKATSASVMATEQGTKAVEAGMRQSSRAGEAIRTLAETVEEAATAALQIAASSKEQLFGMDQIALAMQNIKTATSQQVAGTRQTEEASMKIRDLGSRLKELAGRFRV